MPNHDNEKHEGITTKLQRKVEEKKEAAKERLNPFSKTNKIHRQEAHERKETLRKEQREAYRKEEIHQAAERGKRQAQQRYAPQKHSVTKDASNFATGMRKTSDRYMFGGLNMGFGSAPKKKPAPQRVTTISKSGTVKITEPVEKPKPKEEEPQDEFWDLGKNFMQPPTPVGRQKKQKTKRIGDLI